MIHGIYMRSMILNILEVQIGYFLLPEIPEAISKIKFIINWGREGSLLKIKQNVKISWF